MNFQKRAIIAISLFTTLFSTSLEKVYDENGEWTGLVNANPDPEGPLWLGHGVEMKKELRAVLDEAPALELLPGSDVESLPAIVDNTLHEEFPPILKQVGGSCAQASGISYCLSYEKNLVLNQAATHENQLAYGFTYSFLNKGYNTSGTVSNAGWDIAQRLGIPTAGSFDSLHAGFNGTEWMNGYENWHEANDFRVSNYNSISIATPEGLETLKRWIYDHGRGDAKGGAAVFSSSMIFDIKTIETGPYKDSLICISKGAATDAHAMTFAGYNDEIGYDINGDGVITNNIDITGDGVVDHQDWERGALLLVNSWGEGWKSDGKVWVSYSTLVKSIVGGSVLVVDVRPQKPRFELKISMTSEHRNSFSITTGMSNEIDAISPIWQKQYGSAFNFSGGDLPLQGKGGSSTLEFGLDVSDWADSITGDSVKFFFMIESELTHGQINSISLMDYNDSIPLETPFEITNEQIKEGLWVYTITVAPNSFLTLQFPNGGETFQLGGTYPVRWLSDKKDWVHVNLYQKEKRIRSLAKFTEDSGEYLWAVHDIPLGFYSIVLEDNNGNRVRSAQEFEVVEPQSISSFPFQLNFDNLDTGVFVSEVWSEDPEDDCRWTVWNGPTPAEGKSGASADNTTGSGNYLYLESSYPNFPFKQASLITPQLTLPTDEECYLSFAYQMYSITQYMGDLHVDILSDGIWREDLILFSGTQSEDWKESSLSLSEYKSKNIQIRFRGVTGESYTSDICLDDITIAIGPPLSIEMNAISENRVKLSVGHGDLSLYLPSSQEKYEITLYNVRGQMVLREEGVHGGQWSSLESSLSQGIYLIKVATPQRVLFTGKVSLGK